MAIATLIYLFILLYVCFSLNIKRLVQQNLVQHKLQIEALIHSKGVFTTKELTGGAQTFAHNCTHTWDKNGTNLSGPQMFVLFVKGYRCS